MSTKRSKQKQNCGSYGLLFGSGGFCKSSGGFFGNRHGSGGSETLNPTLYNTVPKRRKF